MNGRSIATIIAAVGGVVLAGNMAGAAFAGVHSLGGRESVMKEDVSGVEEIRLDVSSSDLVVRFGDVEEAELQVSGHGTRNWELTRDGDVLVVRNSWNGVNWFFDGFDMPSGGWFGALASVELVLPQSLEKQAVDLTVDVNVGKVDADGDFGTVNLDVGAGEASIDGSAVSVIADIDAGSADVQLADVETADLKVGAGELDVVLTGSAPKKTTVNVNVGSIDLTLPDVEYDLRSSASLGSINNDLRTRSGSSNTIDAKVDIGEAWLRAE